MPKRLTQDEWLERARAVHGEKYGYEKVEYVNSSTKLLITCQVHGDFLQSPVDHVHSKAGCPQCADERNAKKRTTELEEYIAKAVEIHGTKYDYSKVSYKTTKDKISIICPEHGEFRISAYSHISQREYGCPSCSIERRGKLHTARSGFMLTSEELKAAIYARHGDAIKVLSPFCSGSEDLLEMSCRVHGPFKRLSRELLKDIKGAKRGCPKCGEENGAVLRRYDADKFAAAFVSRNTNDYRIKDLSQFVSMDDKITLVCSKHGEFDAVPKAVIHAGKTSKNCPTCAIEARTHNTEIFIEKATAKHGYKYSYDKVNYTKAHNYVTVTCPEHGDFEIKAYVHLNGGGCPKCITSGTSQMESDLCDYVSSLGVTTVARSKKVIPPQELDIYVPSKKLGIEFCGVYWHSEEVLSRSYHKDKLAAATSAGLRLITVFEDEWIEKRQVVEELLKRTVLGSNLIKLGARKLVLEQVDAKTAGGFYLEHHLQGPTPAEAHFALLTAGQIACLASFSRSSSRAFIGGKRPASDLEVVRFCSHPQISVMGGLNRLVSAAVAHFSGINRVTSYIDLRWFTGSNYLRSGFSLEHVTDPGYFYVKAQQRFSRFSFAKHTLHMKLEKFDPALSEWENMKANKYRRIYDCGHLKLVKSV